MHEVILMQVLDGLANASEVALDQLFIELSVAKLDLLVETASGGVLQDHIGDVLFFLVVVIDELDDVGVDELVMHIDLLLRVLVVDLGIREALPSLWPRCRCFRCCGPASPRRRTRSPRCPPCPSRSSGISSTRPS